MNSIYTDSDPGPVFVGQFAQFAGHSLGGALATLAALHLALQGYEVECVTFGCPKVGDED